jgi:hypothetical protein
LLKIIVGRYIDAAMQSIPSAIEVITEKIGPGYINSHLTNFLMLKVEVPQQGNQDGARPAYSQNHAVNTYPG